MVLVEEILDDEEAKSPALRAGFLDKAKDKPLYPAEGSPEGHVSQETHKAHAEHKMNNDIHKGMNRGAQDNNNIDRPAWYTPDWPKDCQYNAPGCVLSELETSGHASELHARMVRDNIRWKESLEPGVKSIRLSFMQATDEDLKEVIERLKGNSDVTELDLSHNHVKDAGVQALVAALAAGAAPNLQELKLYNNEFGDLGQTMLTQGLPVFRKKLQVHWKEPAWAKFTKPAGKDEAVAKEE
ncbi:unnamed protein product [Prorocentrum cordatum]|uniref:Uncharacterized protein n=1 Tax=Prorocentrum cordatum TaxID=2364126 RepID=A0ABN9UM20_9DINO|nr:unnamed protein product [Polarella glacialis]